MATMTEMDTSGAADPMVPRVARIRRRYREIPHTWTLELDSVADSPGFAPGQFNMLYAMGVGEMPVSLSGDPAGDVLIHTIRDVGAVSGALANLKRSQELGLRGPFGSAWPLAAAAGRDVVVMAGGLGLAPLRPLLYSLFATPEDYGNITLLYGTRSAEDILYRRELDRWRERKRARIEITVDHATAEWSGHVGVVTSLVTAGLFDPDNTVAFICGPEVMMRFSIGSLMDMGLPPEAVYVSMERNMKCAIGHCGHCQFGPDFICMNGPVFRFDRVRGVFGIREF